MGCLVASEQIRTVEDRLRTLLLDRPDAWRYLPAAETAGAALEVMLLAYEARGTGNTVLLLAAEPGRSVGCLGVVDLGDMTVYAAETRAALGDALFVEFSFSEVAEALRRRGAPDVGAPENDWFIAGMLGLPRQHHAVAAIRKEGLVPAVVALASPGAEHLIFLPLAFAPSHRTLH